MLPLLLASWEASFSRTKSRVVRLVWLYLEPRFSDPNHQRPMDGLSHGSCCFSLFTIRLVRFWGWEENAREVAKNNEELAARAAAGLPAYGQPTMDDEAQAGSARLSKYSALKFCKSIHSVRLDDN